MRSTKTMSVAAVLLAALFSQNLGAFPGGDPLVLESAVIVNAGDGSVQVYCEETTLIERHAARQWDLTVLDVPGGDDPASSPVAGRLSCMDALTQPEGTETPESQGPGGILISGSIKVLVNQKMQNERVVAVDIETGDPPALRKVYFSEQGGVYIPLFAPGAQHRDMSGSGIDEMMLRISVAEQPRAEHSLYGRIWVESEREGAQVLLDGGVVGAIPAAGELMLKNVVAGWHELALGHEDQVLDRKGLRVQAGRTALAQLGGGEAPNRFQLEPLGANAQGFEEYRRGQDGAVVVRIPQGEFMMGNTDTERSPFEHMVYLEDYLVDKTGVTWGQYKAFASDTGTPLPPREIYWGIHDDQPAAFVTWEESSQYCEWAGGRLPTEAEREKAARGTDERLFPWGDEEPTPELAVFRRSWGYDGPASVGTHPAGASPYGLLDMGGNLWEWCSDWYSDEYLEQSPYRDPRGPENGVAHVVRGGSWDSRPTVLSASCRNWGHRGYRDGDFGFRCAMNAPE